MNQEIYEAVRENAIKEFKKKLKYHFCKQEYIQDKTKWRHPDNTCIPIVVEADIEFLAKTIAEAVPKRADMKDDRGLCGEALRTSRRNRSIWNTFYDKLLANLKGEKR